jgi:hypothetical protein
VPIDALGTVNHLAGISRLILIDGIARGKALDAQSMLYLLGIQLMKAPGGTARHISQQTECLHDILFGIRTAADKSNYWNICRSSLVPDLDTHEEVVPCGVDTCQRRALVGVCLSIGLSLQVIIGRITASKKCNTEIRRHEPFPLPLMHQRR